MGAALALWACGGQDAPRAPRPSLRDSTRPLVQQVSPAYWQYHPREPAPLAQARPLGSGKILYVGERGERWLVSDETHQAEPASELAPEPLVGSLDAPGPPWVFVGASGTTYEADEPLGPLLGASSPPHPLARVASGTRSLVGIDVDGHLLLSEDAGLSWRRTGPEAARFCDVAMLGERALALEVPERLRWSTDGGRSFRLLDAAPFGATSVVVDEDAGLTLASPLGARSLRAGAPPSLESLGRLARQARPTLDAPPRKGPNATAVSEGRAFLTEDRYFEVEIGTRAESLSGKLTGALRRRAVPELDACQSALVAGFRSWVYVACTRQRTGGTKRYEFFRSEDGGRSFDREPYEAQGRADAIRLAVGRDGDFLVTGLCLPRETLPGCRPQGIQQRTSTSGDAGRNVELKAAVVPALEASALALTFSADGTIAYAIGRRTKSDSVFAFVARDARRGFVARPIEALTRLPAPSPKQVVALSAARDGNLALVISRESGPHYLVLMDSEARTLSINRAPVESAAIGAHGTRALAVTAEGAWESLSGGARWQSIGRLPTNVCGPNRGRCEASVYCQFEGCVAGTSISRIGWRGQRRSGTRALAPAESRRTDRRRAVATPLSCDLSDSEWTELSGVRGLPTALESAIGDAEWFALATDDRTASVTLWVAEGRGREVRASVLLPPASRPAQMAYRAKPQVEGAAALRYPLPGSGGNSSTDVEDVEIAWDNLLTGRRGRARLAHAGSYVPGDYSKSGGAARRANPDLISIANHGIYVRVHRHPEHRQPTYFLDGKRVETVPKLEFRLPLPKGATAEMVHIGDEHVALVYASAGPTMVRATRRGNAWALDAMTLGFVEKARFGLSQSHGIAYLGERAGIHLRNVYADGSGEGRLYPFEASGPVFSAGVRVPTQADVEDGSLGCSTVERSNSPRVVTTRHPGKRRPVLVHDSVDALRVMLTDYAVMHGTPEHPCVASYDAEVAGSQVAARGKERAIIGTRGDSWLFRFSPASTRHQVRIEYRAMECHLDPGVEVPSEVYEMEDTRAP